MAILAFQQPDKVVMLEANEKFGKFEFRPLEPGYGITVGNALRRILLSSLEGFAITSLKVEGVQHEFSAITGVVEDVTEMILNIKQIRLKQVTEGVNSESVNVTISGRDTFRAGNLNKAMAAFEVLNPELVICHMEPKTKLHLKLEIEKGRGYVPAEENRPENAEIGLIAIDSIYTPIKNVKFAVENYRVEQKTDYEKLVIEVETDGSIHPEDALKEAARILIHHFMLFSDEKITIETEEKPVTDEFDEELLHMRQLLKTRLQDMDLSVRALNCLKAAEVDILGDLVKYSKNDLLKFRNFGKKSLTELDELLDSMNLTFGMDIVKYKLDKD
ncbi:MAG: DNA-directed RNA polymerase subunit alpha [Bacteroidales bacterium]|jgi:DNA-directed RNA polymerase subunit alpha|nr:DNA-directed RNA polymerase subunit alpha [Bacteroidales bacterium]